MVTKLSELYFYDIGMKEEFTKVFHINAAQSIKQLCDNTFCLLGGEEAALLQTLERLFLKCKIRIATYKKPRYWNYWKYRQEYFWIKSNEHFVWIEDYQESLLKRDEELHGVCGEQSYLIIQEKIFMDLFKAEIQNLLDEGEMSSAIADRILIESMKLLRKMQVIYKQYRSDSIWGRPAAAYPVYELRIETEKRHPYPFDYDSYEYDYDGYDREDYIERTKCIVSCEAVIHFNTSHSGIAALKKRMEEGDLNQRELFEEIDNLSVEGMGEEEIHKIRRSFASGKSLFKE